MENSANLFELLNVSMSASRGDIDSAYLFLKKIDPNNQSSLRIFQARRND